MIQPTSGSEHGPTLASSVEGEDVAWGTMSGSEHGSTLASSVVAGVREVVSATVDVPPRLAWRIWRGPIRGQFRAVGAEGGSQRSRPHEQGEVRGEIARVSWCGFFQRRLSVCVGRGGRGSSAVWHWRWKAVRMWSITWHGGALAAASGTQSFAGGRVGCKGTQRRSICLWQRRSTAGGRHGWEGAARAGPIRLHCACVGPKACASRGRPVRSVAGVGHVRLEAAEPPGLPGAIPGRSQPIHHGVTQDSRNSFSVSILSVQGRLLTLPLRRCLRFFQDGHCLVNGRAARSGGGRGQAACQRR